MKYTKFTKQFSLQKTLRFELRPVGETADYIKEYRSDYIKSIVQYDIKRDDNYQEIKGLIDDLHRAYIDQRLSSSQQELGPPVNKKTGELVITPDDLNCAFDHYTALKTDPADKKLQNLWSKQQDAMRKKLVKIFSDKADLFGKGVIVKTLPDFLKKNGTWDEHQELVESFRKFTTYFKGFDENRKNMYVSEDKATSIANRAINENLPMFFDNCIAYQKISAKCSGFHFRFSDEKTLRLLGVKSDNLSDAFRPEFYLKLFSQHGIDIYHDLLGGYTSREDKITGLNEQINLFRQENQKNPELNPRNFPTFARLHKQILAETTSSSFSYEPYKSDQDMLSDLKELMEDSHFDELQKTIDNLKRCNPERVYIRSNSLNQLSNSWLDSHWMLDRALDFFVEESGKFRTKEDKEKYKSRPKNQVYFSLAEVQQWVHYIDEHVPEERAAYKRAMQKNGETLTDYFCSVLQRFDLENLENVVRPLLELNELDSSRRPPKTLDDDDEGGKGFHQVSKIQSLLDGYNNCLKMFRPLHLVHKRKPITVSADQDLSFYHDFSALFDLINKRVLPIYNKTRNHVTRKPFSSDKVKINFDNPNLMAGWDTNKERDNSCVLFEKEGNYYLGILHPEHRGLFDYRIGIDDHDRPNVVEKKKALRNKIVTDTGSYRKIVYKLLPGPNKMLPKVFFSKSRVGFFNPSDEVLRIRNTSSHTTNGDPQNGFVKAEFNLNDCHILIDFFKVSIQKHCEWREYGFCFRDTSDYQDISEFYKEVQDQGYKIEFDCISDQYIDDCVRDGKLFLFRIYNKDFSPHSKGTPNMHSLYWRGLFEDRNLQDVVLKLNGEAEMFFRPHSIQSGDRKIHPKNQHIPRKTMPGHNLFSYDIIKDRRYTQDKFFLHVPITLNHKASNQFRFNGLVNRAISSDTNVIGIDRGERHLLYYCVVNPQGEIIEQGSWNKIKQGDQVVDYQQKLEQRQKLRNQARKSWTSVENIKELKHGYLSQVVHKLSQLIIEHRAIVCLEDLNFGFKRGRFKVEKQVYQKFEKALIDKLNYLVNKQEKDPLKPGHYLNALQLTAPFQSFDKVGKQSGILYYVNANYTSKICPVTGFVNLLRPYYQNIDKSKEYFRKFKEIRYNSASGYFSFEFDYTRTNPQAKHEGCRTHWSVCSHGTRLVNKKDDHAAWQTEVVDPTEKLVEAFGIAGIDYASGDNLIEEIIAQDSSRFFKSLMYGLRLTLQMRNSRSNSTAPEDDYLISPVADEKGNFYNSLEAGADLPEDADANGAYHIALKGLWNIQQITEYDWSVEKARGPKLYMTNEKWWAFAQNKPFRQ